MSSSVEEFSIKNRLNIQELVFKIVKGRAKNKINERLLKELDRDESDESQFPENGSRKLKLKEIDQLLFSNSKQ